MSTIYLNIGSNCGDRHALIEQAVAALSELFPGATIRRSDYIETEPWGFESENKFLNLGIAIDNGQFSIDNGQLTIDNSLQNTAVRSMCQLSPEDKLSIVNCPLSIENCPLSIETCQLSIETCLLSIVNCQLSIDNAPHRDAEGNYIDRKIDIDIIAIDDMVIDTPKLTIPHPRMHQREFVLKPMVQLAPDWRHPILNLTAKELLDNLLKKQ